MSHFSEGPGKNKGPAFNMNTNGAAFARMFQLLQDKSLNAGKAFTEACVLNIEGDLNKEHLQNTWQQLFDLYPGLLSNFSGDGNKGQSALIQSAYDKTAGPEEALKLAASGSAPDAFTGPLLTGTLFINNNNSFFLVLQLHHAAGDRHLLRHLIFTLAELYTNLSKNRQEKVSAADGSSQIDIDAAEKFWTTHYPAEAPVVEFPGEYNRPAIRNFEAKSCSLRFDEQLSGSIQALATAMQSPLTDLLRAAFELFVYRLTSQPELVIAGSLHEGRDTMSPQTGSIPYFLRIDPKAPFSELLQDRIRNYSEARKHADFTADDLALRLGVPEDAARVTLVPVRFDAYNESVIPDFDGCRCTVYNYPRAHEYHEVFAECVISSNEISFRLRFNAGLFDAGVMDLRLHEFRTLLESICREPSAPVGWLNILPPDELAFLNSINDESRAPLEAPYGVHERIDRVADALGDTQVAVVAGEYRLKYSELKDLSSRMAKYFQSKGLQPGSFIGVCMPRQVELPAVLLGVMKAGAAYVPMDHYLPSDRLLYMLEDSGASFVVTTPEIHRHAGFPDNRVIYLHDLVAADNGTDYTKIPVDKNTLSYILYTSGSTGRPKAVAARQSSLVSLLVNTAPVMGINRDTPFLAITTISFDASVLELVSPLITGATLHLATREQSIDPAWMDPYIESRDIRFIFATPATLELMLNSGWEGKKNLSIIAGGEALRTELTDKLLRTNKSIWNIYGPTETTIFSTYICLDTHGSASARNGVISIGGLVPNTRVYILDPNGQRCPVGVKGELLIAGEGVSAGYHNRPELTAEKYIPSPDGNGKAYRTGDGVLIGPDKLFYFMHRLDHQVKIRGFRIELGEIEMVIDRFPGVVQNAVVVREDRPGQKTLAAYMVMEEGRELDIRAIRDFLGEKLPEYMVPPAFVQMKKFPRTASGKIDRKNLPVPDNKRPELGIAYKAPVSRLEKNITDIWARVLNFDRVGTRDNFFDLGGNSLLALSAVSALRQETGRDISVIRIYQHPTVEGLAGSMEGSENGRSLKQDMQERASGRSGKHSDDAEEAIALVGMAIRFPGADSVDEFWKNLCSGTESTRFFKKEELDPSLPYDLVSDPTYVAARGVIRNPDSFDNTFFNMNPHLARVMDPQQRILLELGWNALENAGYDPATGDKLIGVFAGVNQNTYFLNNVQANPEAIKRVGNFLTMTHNEKDYVATRLAYELNLKGPALSIHTACSTSLVAIATACDSLWNRQCDMALAGGAAITCPVNSGHRYEEGAMLSNDGHTRTFDSQARGTVFSDGAGVVILKRYKDAVADGDTIYALIRGAAINNDGGSKGSFTAPSVDGQAAVISMAQAMGGVDPSTISYIEAHGTATPLGDPIEIEGLTKAFREHTDKRQYCAIGSVKSNFGHLTIAAGVAGLIKTALSLYHKVLPPSINYRSPNPQIRFEDTPFFVINSLRPWETSLLPRRAGVSSFGVGGTNAHVVLEEAPIQQPSGESLSRQLILLSGRSEAALEARKQQLAGYLREKPEASLADMAYTLQVGRHSFQHRFFAVTENRDELLDLLGMADPKRCWRQEMKQVPEGVAFMFPGQGSQYPGMGSSLYRDEIIFRAAVDECTTLFTPHLGRDLREVMFDKSQEELLRQTLFTQPALFTLGYSLARLWMSWGIHPSALVGHSIGEFAAAAVAGVFSLEDAVTVVATRSRLMQDLPSGAMLSVRLPEDKVRPHLNNSLSVAAVNGPQLCVVAGPFEEIERLQKMWVSEEVMCKLLHTSHAFHSPMMEPVVAPFAEAIKKVKLNPPSIPILSTVSNEWLSDEQATDPMYWAKHIRATVRFAGGIKALWEKHPGYLMLELGPRNTATTLARQQATDPQRQKAIPSLADTTEGEAEWIALLMAAGQLWSNGMAIAWKAFHALENRRRIALPGYPFEHKSFWLDPAVADSQNAENTAKPIGGASDTSAASTTSPSGSTAVQEVLMQQIALMQQQLNLWRARNSHAEPAAESQTPAADTGTESDKSQTQLPDSLLKLNAN